MVKMHVDEQGKHQLSNYNGIRHNKRVTESVHAKVELTLNIQFPQAKPTRNEAYNYKSEKCQKYFHSLTTDTNKFTMCFQNTNCFPDQIKEWEKTFKSCIVQSFHKVRSKKRKFSETEVGKLLEERKRIKLVLKDDHSDLNERKKNDIEIKIYEASEIEYMRKIQDTLGHVIAEEGGINTNGLWRAKRNIIPNDRSNNPIALKDKRGNMITSPDGI